MSAATNTPSMSKRERALLDAETNGTAPLLMFRTQTRVDTGGWLRRSVLWLCATDSEIILLTSGRRQYSEKIALTEAQNSWYCHTTGQLVIEPGERLRFHRVDLSPTDALQVLTHIKEGSAATKGRPTTVPETKYA